MWWLWGLIIFGILFFIYKQFLFQCGSCGAINVKTTSKVRVRNPNDNEPSSITSIIDPNTNEVTIYKWFNGYNRICCRNCSARYYHLVDEDYFQEVSETIPCKICPTCNGKGSVLDSRECNTCKGNKWLPK